MGPGPLVAGLGRGVSKIPGQGGRGGGGGRQVGWGLLVGGLGGGVGGKGQVQGMDFRVKKKGGGGVVRSVGEGSADPWSEGEGRQVGGSAKSLIGREGVGVGSSG